MDLDSRWDLNDRIWCLRVDAVIYRKRGCDLDAGSVCHHERHTPSAAPPGQDTLMILVDAVGWRKRKTKIGERCNHKLVGLSSSAWLNWE